MELYRVEVGRKHGVRPSNIVGAIMNEAGLEGGMIGNDTPLKDLFMGIYG